MDNCTCSRFNSPKLQLLTATKSNWDPKSEDDDDKAAVAVDVFIELSASMSSKLADGISFCSTEAIDSILALILAALAVLV
uniref:Uncharacterized protein n=1 Tax=Glossina palpalis gambiensis TaxID=67801 RepID=A0A1B0BQV4_9MUSC